MIVTFLEVRLQKQGVQRRCNHTWVVIQSCCVWDWQVLLSTDIGVTVVFPQFFKRKTNQHYVLFIKLKIHVKVQTSKCFLFFSMNSHRCASKLQNSLISQGNCSERTTFVHLCMAITQFRIGGRIVQEKYLPNN